MTDSYPTSRAYQGMPPAYGEDEGASDKTWRKSAEALKRLHQRYFKKLIGGILTTYGAGPPEPEEIAQRTFTKLSEKQNLHTIKDLEGYAWITARNFILSEKRAMRVRADYAQAISGGTAHIACDNLDPERVLIGRGEIETVAEVINQMSERRRAIFLACRIEGITPEAAGRRLGVSRSSAVRHVAVATAMISEALGRIPAGQQGERAK